MTSSFFPRDEYTPLGLLDNPWHTWKISRRGTFRTNRDFGLDWLLPNGQNPSLCLSARLFVRIASRWLPISQLCHCSRARPIATYHTKNVLRLALAGTDSFAVEWIALEDAVLGFSVKGGMPQGEGVALVLTAGGETRLALWEFGWTARVLSARSALLREYAEGSVFALLVSDAPGVQAMAGFPPHGAENDWISGREGADVAVRWEIPTPRTALHGVISLGWAESEAMRRAGNALSRFQELREQRLAEDEEFWARAPRLTGDWPAHWRRGWVYDYETLRMVVRRPVGIFAGRWDGMQVQKPRLVLAETALDAWTLAFADPQAAKEIVATAFQSAVADNVPCVREDGSTNMVAEDGSECGTGPNWCLPFTAIREIFTVTGDLSWAKNLLPHLEAYVRWWLRNRVDDRGWAFFKCSWESGQDSSPRFRVPQPTGGELVEHLKPVDLHAGLLDAVRAILYLRRQLRLPAEGWPALARRFRGLLRRMWCGEGFCDLDARDGTWVNSEDLSCFAPFAVTASWPSAWKAAARLRLRRYPDEPELWLEWPSFWLLFAEAARNLGERSLLTDTLAWRADSVYRAWDSRDWQGTRPVPGTAAECWGIDEPRGSEGYGWGATLPLHIFRGFFGLSYLRKQKGLRLRLAPHFPPSWPTGSYGVENIPVLGHRVSIVADVGAGGVELKIRARSGRIRLRNRVRMGTGRETCAITVPLKERESLTIEVTSAEDSPLRI